MHLRRVSGMRFIALFCWCLVVALPLQAQSTPKGAHIKFAQTEYNFGEVSRKGENRSCLFTFENDGTEPLVILAVTTTCSCLKIEYPRKPIAVGAKGEIRLLLESKKMEAGVFRRVVQVRSTSVGGAEVLTIKGFSKD